MLLPLLGACVVVGPFQGPEWEPVLGLLSEDHSCRDPRCCGNLLVLCLFLIWQVQHYWQQITRTHPSMKKVIKVPLQKWAVPSTRHDTCFRMTHEFFSLSDFSGLDAHVQQWAQKKRHEYRRSLQESWNQYLLSWQHPRQGSSWDFCTPFEPFFCTTSFSSTCMLSQDSSWEAWQVPWCLSDEQTHLICKPLSSPLDRYQKMEQLLVHSQEELMPLESVVSMRSHLKPMILATSLKDFLPDPSNQQVGMSTWKSWGCSQKTWVPERENHMLVREALEWGSQTESSGEDTWEIQATVGQLPMNFEMEDDAETKVLEWRSQRLVICKTDGDILTLGSKNQDQMGIENRAKIQELGNRNEREAEGENPPEIQAHIVEKQKQLRCKTDAETQTLEWRNQDKSRNDDAVEIQAFENKKEAREENEGETQAQGLGKQDQTGSEDGEENQVPGWGKQDKIRDDTGIGIQAQEWTNKVHVGGENDMQTQVSRRENLAEVKQEEGVETQTLGWEKQECIGSENVIGILTPGWGKQDQGGSEKAGRIQASREEIWKQLRHELLVGWRNQGLRKGEVIGEAQLSRGKNLREIRQEDWVVIHTPWWGDERPVASEIDRECKISYWGNQVQIGGKMDRKCEIPCWGNQDQIGGKMDRECEISRWENQDQIGGELRAETQAPEKRDQRKGGDEDDTNTLAPEEESQGQLRCETHIDTHPPERRNQEQFEDENSIDIQALEKRNRRVKDEDGKEIQELGEENQGQLSSKHNAKIHTPMWENQEYIRGKDGANTQVSEAENGGELTSKIDEQTYSAEWKKEGQVGDENGAEIQVPEKTSQREAGGEDDTDAWEPREENQSQLKGVTDRKTHLSEWKNQEQPGGENRTEIQAGSEDAVENQRPERENQGRLARETRESHSPGRSNGEQTGGKKEENQTLGKRSQREAGSEDNGKVQGLRGGPQRLITTKIDETSCSSEWKNLEQVGSEHGAETEIQGKRNPRGTTGGDGTETQAPGGDYQGQVRSEVDGEIRIQGPGNQNKGGDEDAAEIQGVRSQRKYRAEAAGGPHIPRGGNEEQVREKDAAKGSLLVDSLEGEGSPAITGSGHEAMAQEPPDTSALCPEMKPLPSWSQLSLQASGEGKHLVSQSMASAKKHRAGVSLAFQQAPPEPWRSQKQDKRVGDPGKTAGLTQQLQNLQSGEFLAAPLGLPSACSSVLCGRAPQAATALAGAPTVLTVPPKGPILKKSQQLLLESLMRWKIVHLKWGFPQRILESHLLFNLLEPCPLPLAGVRLPGLYTVRELQQQQERHCEAQGFRPGLESTERSQRVQLPERKSPKLPTQDTAPEKCGSHQCKSMGISIHSEKPGRVRPPGGTREPLDVQEEVPPRAKAAAAPRRSSRPAAQSRSWCGPEPASENSRDRKMVRLGASQMVEMAPCRGRTSYPRTGHDHWRKERISQEAPKPPSLKCQRPTHGRRGSLEAAGSSQAGQEPSSCFTNTSSFKYSLHSAAARLSMTLLNKVSCSSHLAKPRHSAPNLSLRDPAPTLLPKLGDQHTRDGSSGVHISLKRDLQPPGHYCAEATLPKTESFRGQGEPENLNGAPQNASTPQKFGFVKHWRCFLLQHGFRK
ncbi:unnamed protein product [Nyctereutes procyonoides]|uniref:(raccoon dog) hypothetical protein n=1 Tax=Nyctereutes procyonoides TaxID=34880 RepID=A0A811YLX3_NYCPR|nr:unnamed protein product [Nyctereutes procyonoides]